MALEVTSQVADCVAKKYRACKLELECMKRAQDEQEAVQKQTIRQIFASIQSIEGGIEKMGDSLRRYMAIHIALMQGVDVVEADARADQQIQNRAGDGLDAAIAHLHKALSDLGGDREDAVQNAAEGAATN
ncbi:uncharacterized protein EKO05_0001812 [Ascochyta rabiei]|nr:uncharacterized protein EKO05_0001812 [Ascochyta rabiei]UPX11192.1 hypothetical protein EKO05_0001812 [Ascochyta rabiei]